MLCRKRGSLNGDIEKGKQLNAKYEYDEHGLDVSGKHGFVELKRESQVSLS
jgi:hypothetical protein